jgi:hypothetical protein
MRGPASTETPGLYFPPEHTEITSEKISEIHLISVISGKVCLMPIHPLLARELRQSKRLQKFFNSLPESSRHQIDREVREVKKEDTRLRRAQHAAEYLMEAMEAEFDPPPLMKAAFRRNAQARRDGNSCRSRSAGNTLSSSSAAAILKHAPSTSREPSWTPPNTPTDTLETPRTRT